MSLKRSNGSGCVYKIGGKRRKPWGARITTGWINDETTGKSKQVFQPIGTYSTRLEAEQALNNYLENPYNIETQKITFEGVYNLWSEEYFSTLKNTSSSRTYIAAFKWSKDLHKMRMRDIRVEHMQGAIKDCTCGYATKGRMKSMYNMMYRFCMAHDIVEKNYAELFDNKSGNKPDKEKVPFTDHEISLLWQHKSFPFADLVLFNIYGGWRPQELTLIRTKHVNLEEGYIVGGMKTDAGEDRIVPIHSKIMDIVKQHYNPDNEFLFLNEYGKKMTYDQYRGRFKKVMRVIEASYHTPHEARYTFISKAKELEMNEYILKLLVGHAIEDVTEKTYTKRKLWQLSESVELIDYKINK